MKRNVMWAVIVLSLVFTVGCKKKEPVSPTAPEGTAQETAKNVDEAAAPVVEKIQVAAEEVKQAFTSDVDLNKTIDALKAEAEKMDVASLKQVALKYKDAITSKKADIEALSDKLAKIPMTEKLGTEAQKLTADIATLNNALAPLMDRFNVYVNAIKAKGGNIAGLTL